MTPELARQLLREMVLIRRFEDRCAQLYTEQKIRGFMHLYNGEEAVAVGVLHALTEEDAVVATYREHGQALVRGLSARSIMAEMFGKQEGCCRGRGGSMHLFDAATRFYGGNAIVGGGLPLAVGMGLADKLQQRSAITCCFFGDGAVAEGEFHESMNLSALWELPVLWVCENNYYAMGTALALTESETDLAAKAASYRVVSKAVDGMDLLAVRQAALEATAYVRESRRPFFLECRTYRFRAHSMFDAELYRQKPEVATWKERDPIPDFLAAAVETGWLEPGVLPELEAEVDAEIEDAVAFADAGTFEPVEELAHYVYSEAS